MKFGGGFYGITAVATLILIEIADLFSFINDFPGAAALQKTRLFHCSSTLSSIKLRTS